jgi:hypothetical protein
MRVGPYVRKHLLLLGVLGGSDGTKTPVLQYRGVTGLKVEDLGLDDVVG